MEKKGAIPEPLITSTPLCETRYPTLSPLVLLLALLPEMGWAGA